MPTEETSPNLAHGAAGGKFPDTRWSLIASAKEPAPALVAKALQELCQLYWQPVYCYIRRRGTGPEDAEDLTQGFFAQFLERKDFSQARKEKGKLRSYLLKSVSHFLADEYDKQTAQKRGGGQAPLSLDQARAEAQYQLEPRDDLAPDVLFEKQWALTLLEDVLHRVRESYEKRNKAQIFDRLQPYLAWNAKDTPITEVSNELGMAEGALRVALFRLRRRYGEALKQAIMETVLDPSEVDDELEYLFSVIRR